jgi:type II secretory pathway pseudopilin PulG
MIRSNIAYAQRRLRGWSLVEILVVIGIVAALAVLGTSIYQKMRKEAMAATCKTKIKNLAVAFGSYLNTHHTWPQASEDLGEAPTEKAETQFDEFWIKAIEPFGPSTIDWVCDSEMSDFRRQQREDAEKGSKETYWSSYLVCQFEEGIDIPTKFSMPWLIEKRPNHDGNTYYHSSGAVKVWREPLLPPTRSSGYRGGK